MIPKGIGHILIYFVPHNEHVALHNVRPIETLNFKE